MSRELRHELRSIRDDVTDEDGATLDAEEQERVVTGLRESDARTRRAAVRILRELAPDAVPIETVFDDLVDCIEAGIGVEDSSERRIAEKAAKLLAGQALVGRVDGTDLTGLAAEMVDDGTPQLRTGGAALLGPPVVEGEFEPGQETIDSLVEHVLITEMAVDSFDSRVDNLRPVLVLFAELSDTYTDEATTVLDVIRVDEYLHGPHGNSRVICARFLAGVADERPDAVADYLLDLAIRLRDGDGQTVLQAGDALASLADEFGGERIRPVVEVLDSALGNDEVAALAGVTKALATAGYDEPGWFAEIPVDGVDDLRDVEAVTDDATLRTRIVQTLCSYAAVTEEDVVDESLVTFALDTVDLSDGVGPVGRAVQLAIALERAATAAPTALFRALVAARGEAALVEASEGSETVVRDLSVVPGESRAETAADDDDQSNVSRARHRIVRRPALAALSEADDGVATAAELALDTDRPRGERRLAAEMLLAWVTSDRADAAPESVDRAASDLAAADDEMLAGVGERLRGHDSAA